MNIDEQSKQLLTENISKLFLFGRYPRYKQAWNEASIALGILGEITGRLLSGKTKKDIAFTSSLNELNGFAENLHDSPENNVFKRHFELSLGDIEYRMIRLFDIPLR